MGEIETTQNETNEIGMSDVPPGVNPAYAKEKPSNVQNSAKDAKEQDITGRKQDSSTIKQEDSKSQAEKKAEAALKKLKIKGREIEVDDAKYHEFAQKGAAATETWMEAAKMKKEFDSFMKDLKENPRKILTDPNIIPEFRKIAEEYVWEKIQEEQMSPEERERQEEKRRLAEYEKREQEARQKYEERQQQELESQMEQEYDKKLGEALSKAGLPKTTGAVRRIADYLMADVKAGVNRDPSEYIQLVEQDYIQDLQEFIGELEPEKLLKFLGEKNAKKLRNADLARLKSTTPKTGHTFVPGKGMQPTQSNKKLSGLDWERQIRREMMGR